MSLPPETTSPSTSQQPESAATSLSNPTRPDSLPNFCFRTGFEFDIASDEQASEIREALHSFFAEHKHLFEPISSYYVTYGLVKSKLSIMVGAKGCKRLKLPESYQGFNVKLHENMVTFAGKSHRKEKLEVGYQIGTGADDDSLFGTLGGFVTIDGKLHAMTCHHIIPNNTEFQYVSKIAQPHENKESKDSEEEDDDESDTCLVAGVSTDLGISAIIDQQWYDYQFLKIRRSLQPSKPFNKYEDKHIKFSTINLELINRKTKFGKYGASTAYTSGYLVNRRRNDCYVKIKGSQVHTFEFAFKFAGRYPLPGDSGSWVFTTDKRPFKAVGMLLAVTCCQPSIAFVTPMSSIVEHFHATTGKNILMD